MNCFELNYLSRVSDITRGKKYIGSRGSSVSIQKIGVSIDGDGLWRADFRAVSTDRSAFTDALTRSDRGILYDGRFSVERPNVCGDIVTVSWFRVLENIDYRREFLDANRTIEIGSGIIRFLRKVGDSWEYEVLGTGDKETLRSYTMFKYTPSELRKNTVKYVRTDKLGAAIDIINKLAPGSRVSGNVSFSKAVKKTARLSLLDPGGLWFHWDTTKWGVVVYCGKFGGPEERVDGAAKLSSGVISSLLGVSEDAAMTQFYQVRLLTSKVAASVESSADIADFVKRCSAFLDAPIVHYKDWSDWGARYEDGVIAWIGSSTAGFLTDMNGFKEVPLRDIDGDNFCILDSAKKTGASTNRQLVQFTQDWDGFDRLMDRLAWDHIKKRIKSVFSDTAVKGVSEDLSTSYLAEVLPRINKDCLSDPYIRRGIENAFVKGINGALRNVHFDIDGYYLRGTGAYEAWLEDEEILARDEIFVNDPRLWGKEAVVLRNPRSCANEYFLCRVVSLSELRSRCNGYYLRRYSLTSPNVVIVPGTRDFKDRTGGSDFDYDGFTVVFDPEFISMLRSKPCFSVGISTSDPDKTVGVSDVVSMIQDSFIFVASSANQGVGECAIDNSKVQSILLDDFLVSDFAREIDRPRGNVAYTRVCTDTVDVDDAFVVGLRDKYLASDRSIESTRAFLGDMSICNVSVMGRIIDAAKTGDMVTNPFVIDGVNVLERYRQKSREWKGIVRDGGFAADTNFFARKGTILVSDPIHRLQLRIGTRICKILNRYTAGIRSVDVAMKKRLRAGLSSLKELDFVTSDLSRVNIVSDLDSRSMGMNALDVCRPYVSDMARSIMDYLGVSPTERFAASKVLGDTFGFVNFREEVLSSVLSMPGSRSGFREELVPLSESAAPGTYEFTDGRCSCFACTSVRLNGSYNVLCDDTGFYVEDDFNKITPSSSSRVFFRIKEGGEKLRARSKESFKINSFLANRDLPDSLIDSSGNVVCTLIMGSDNVSILFHGMTVSVDDIIEERFRRDKDGTVKEIHLFGILGTVE